MNVQINKDYAEVQNIGHQHISIHTVGSAFVLVENHKEKNIMTL